jgi:hypothetical protein
MAHTTFAQPPPTPLGSGLAKGYWESGAPASKFEMVGWAPAGAASSDADDMARFMIAHLQLGRLGETQVLQAATARQMHTRQFQAIAGLNGNDLGFYDSDINGHRVIGHGGDTELFHTALFLYLDDGVGLFVALNSPGRADAASTVRKQLFEGFSDRYWPAAEPATHISGAAAADNAKRFSGAFASTRASRSSFLVGLGLLGQVTPTVNADGTLSFTGFTAPSGAPRRYREVSPWVWREVGGHDRIAAVARDGQVVRFSSDELSPTLVYERVPAWRSAALVLPALALALGSLALQVAAWPAAAIWRRRRGIAFPLTGLDALADRGVRLTGLITLLAAGGWLWLLSGLMQHSGIFDLEHHMAEIHLIQLLTILGVVCGLGAAAWNLVAVWRRRAAWPRRVWSLVLGLAFLLLLGGGAMLNLLNFNVNF